MSEAFAIAVVLLAAAVHGVLGVGFPLVATPLLALVLDVREAVLLTLLPTAALNIASVLRGGGGGAILRRFWPLALCSIVGSAIGTQLLATSDPRPFDLALAALIGLYLWTTGMDAGNREPMPGIVGAPQHFPRASMLGFGLVAGLAAGTTNVMVPVLIVYTLELGLERRAMVQLFNFCFVCGKAAQIAVFGMAGAFTAELTLHSAGLALVALGALWAGMQLQDRISEGAYRRGLRILLGALALLLVFRFFAG